MVSPEKAAQQLLDLHVPANATGMDAVHTALAGCWSSLESMRPLQQRWRDEFSLAVAEVAANIIQHAHAPASPEVAEGLVEFTLQLLCYPDHLQARFVDAGIAATPPEAPVMPSVTVSYTDLGERGRGLALVQATTDHFQYYRTPDGENVWIIEKHFPA